jgi:hypothetical protein
VKVAREGDAVPQSAPALFADLQQFFKSPLNDAGNVAFVATLTNAGSADTGIYYYDAASGAPTTVMLEGFSVPEGGATFTDFILPVLSSDHVAFLANINTGSGPLQSGIYRWAPPGGGNTVKIARKGDAPPEGNGVFYSFDPPAINDSAVVAFVGYINQGRPISMKPACTCANCWEAS